MNEIFKRIKSQVLLLALILTAGISLIVSCESDTAVTVPGADPDLFADVSGAENLKFEALFRSQKIRIDDANQLSLSGEYSDGDKTYMLVTAVYSINDTDTPIEDGSYAFYSLDAKPTSGFYAAAVFRCITSGEVPDTVDYEAYSGTFTLIPSGNDLNGTIEFDAKSKTGAEEISLKNGRFFRAGVR